MSQPGPDAVSVIIPVHNGARYLGAAIESVLSNDARPMEVIVVDDGSTDGSGDVARAFDDVMCVSLPHSGVGAALNAGVALARGALIAFLDADDVWAPGKLEAQMELLHRRPELEAVGAYVEEFPSEDLAVQGEMSTTVRPDRYQAPLPSTVLIRKEALARLGPFSESPEAGSAMDFVLRLRDSGLKWAVAPGALVRRRIHLNNSGRTSRTAQHREYLLAIKRSLDRRRAQRPLRHTGDR